MSNDRSCPGSESHQPARWPLDATDPGSIGTGRVGSENSVAALIREFPQNNDGSDYGAASPWASLTVSAPSCGRSPTSPSAACARSWCWPSGQWVQGDRDPGAAPRARDPAPQAAAALPPSDRSGLARNAELALAEGALVGVRRTTRDPPSLAPSPRRPTLDVPNVSSADRRPPTADRRPPTADRRSSMSSPR